MLRCYNLMLITDNETRAEAASEAKNARHLLSIPELAQDVEFCMQRDTHPVIGSMNTDGSITI